MVKVPDKVKLCQSNLGFRNFDLFVNPSEQGGEGLFAPVTGGKSTVTIGLNGPWGRVLSTLMHELMEMALVDKGCQYTKFGAWNEGSTGNRYFMMSHDDFDDACERAAYSIKDVLPKLSAAYKKSNKPKKLTKKKK